MAHGPITDDDLASYEAMIDAADFGILRLNLHNPRYIEELKPGYTNGGPAIADVSGPPARADLLAIAPAALKLMIGEVRRLRATPEPRETRPMGKSYRDHLKGATEHDPVVADLREAARLITRAHRSVCEAAYNETQTCNAVDTGGLLERLNIVGSLIGAILRPKG